MPTKDPRCAWISSHSRLASGNLCAMPTSLFTMLCLVLCITTERSEGDRRGVRREAIARLATC